MYIWGKGWVAGRVGSGQTFCRQSRVGSGRVNVSPGRVGSGPRKVTRGQLWSARRLRSPDRRLRRSRCTMTLTLQVSISTFGTTQMRADVYMVFNVRISRKTKILRISQEIGNNARILQLDQEMNSSGLLDTQTFRSDHIYWNSQMS